MSIYTPLFPHASLHSSSSSGSSSGSGRLTENVHAYSVRLSQQHLSLARIPEVLCPSSRESSPTSKSRSECLQAKIEDAVSQGRYIGDLCKTRFARRGIASKYIGLVADGGATEIGDVPTLLPDTEGEWFKWERKLAESRSGRGNKSDSNALVRTALDGQPSGKINKDKVADWQAGLDAPKLAQTQQAFAKRTRSETATLGFPVVKRATVLKSAKGKRPSTSFSQSSLGLNLQDHRRANELGPGEPPRHQIEGVVSSSENSGAHNQPVTTDICFQAPADGSSQMPPPSFPQDLATSTPRNEPKQAAQEIIDISSNDEISLQTPADNAQPQAARRSRQTESANSLRNPVQEHVPTPPSPPESIHGSPRRRKMTLINPSVSSDSADPAEILNGKTARPPTPTSIESEPPVQIVAPRTPDHSPLKKHRTEPYVNLSNLVGPSTPKSVVNGARRKQTMPFQRTPEPAVFVDLAASKRSLPRLKPPRQLAIQNFPAMVQTIPATDDETELSDTSPAKSERSYFSSPGSGSSEPSPALARYGADLLSSSPLAHFSQSPTRFAPIAESTQMSAPARFGNLQGSPSGVLSRSAKHSLTRESSGIIAMPFNSQYDVNGNIDQVSHLLEKDVDFGEWIKDLDDEEEEVQVEDLTTSQ